MRVVFVNRRTLQPGCVLIQAGLGGDRNLLEHFGTDDWQVDGLDEMRPVPAARVEEVARVRARFRESGAELAESAMPPGW